MDRKVLKRKDAPVLYAPWLSNNMLLSIEVEPDWQHNGHYDVVNDDTMCPMITDDTVKFAFPNGSENNMERAMELIGACSIDIKHLQWRKMQLRNGDVVHVLRTYVLPSVKNKVSNANSEESEKMTSDGYLTFVVCGLPKQSNGSSNQLKCPKIMEYPASCCGCPDGRLFCSHLAACVGLMGMMQVSETIEEFEDANIKENASSSQSLAFPIEMHSMHSNN